MISKSLENVANCAYAKSPSLEGSKEGDLPHLGFQKLTCMFHIPLDTCPAIVWPASLAVEVVGAPCPPFLPAEHSAERQGGSNPVLSETVSSV